MKLAFLMMAMAIQPAFAGGLPRTNQWQEFSFLSVPTATSTNQPGTVSLWDFGSASNHLALNIDSTNSPVVSMQNKTMALVPDSKSMRPDLLPPGVYKTSPYTILALVPGPQNDDCYIKGQGTGQPEKMPSFQPELRFIPYSSAEK
jgi:hypothetical protein